MHTLARVYYVYYERVGVLWEYGVYAYTPPSLNMEICRAVTR